MKKIISVLLLVLTATISFAAPNVTFHMNDNAGMFSKSTESKLEYMLQNFESRSKTRIAVVTVDSLQGKNLNSFVSEIVDSWQGYRNENRILLFFSKNDRKWKVEISRGLTNTISGQKSKDIMTREFVSRAKNGDFDGGLIACIESFMTVIGNGPVVYTKNATVTPQPIQKEESHVGLYFFLFIGLLLLGFMIFLFIKNKRQNDEMEQMKREREEEKRNKEYSYKKYSEDDIKIDTNKTEYKKSVPISTPSITTPTPQPTVVHEHHNYTTYIDNSYPIYPVGHPWFGQTIYPVGHPSYVHDPYYDRFNYDRPVMVVDNHPIVINDDNVPSRMNMGAMDGAGSSGSWDEPVREEKQESNWSTSRDNDDDNRESPSSSDDNSSSGSYSSSDDNSSSSDSSSSSDDSSSSGDF